MSIRSKNGGYKMNQRVQALLRKESLESLRSKEVLYPIIIIQAIFAIIFPLAILVSANFVTEGSEALTDLEPLIALLPIEISQLETNQLLIRLTLDYLFPIFFLLVPIISASVISASSFISEKISHTLESLLYTPITMRELLMGKIIGTFIPAYLVSLVACVIFGIIMNIGGFYYFGQLIFPNLAWLLIIFWLSPAFCLLSIILTAFISAKAQTFQGAQQLSGILVIPIILLFVSQMTGVLIINSGILLLIGSLVMLLNIILIRLIARHLDAESLLR